jgi:hypothetical protein
MDGRIGIVELPSTLHEKAVYRTVAMATATGDSMGTYLGHQAGDVENPPAGVAGERKWEPDCCFGPSDTVVGAVLPP